MSPAWPAAATLASALPLAWAIDRWFGEPRDAWHPVAWLGHLLAPVGRRLLALDRRAAFIGGVLVWVVVAAAIGAAAWAIQTALLAFSPWAAVPLLAIALKPTFAWRMLRDEAAAVGTAMDDGLEAARTRLARLVSRDVRLLDADAVRETAIETVAENLNDSLVAPLFWYALLGLPGAAVYRFANTADAMWGYRGTWEWAGKWSAWADDVLSWMPARLTALLLMPTARATAWRRLRTEARLTLSPNGGWPMGAMALRLGVRLRKPGVYALNADAPSPQPAQLRRALQIAGRAAAMGVAIVTLSWSARAVFA